MFSENFSLQDLMENDVTVDDFFQIGSSKVNTTHPRMPCDKRGIRYGRMHVIKNFLARGNSRIDFGVSQEGELVAVDIVEEVLIRDHNRVTVADIFRLHEKGTRHGKTLRLAVKLSTLPDLCNRIFLNRRIKKDESKIN
jgi:MOSC domain-containing protein YiiM